MVRDRVRPILVQVNHGADERDVALVTVGRYDDCTRIEPQHLCKFARVSFRGTERQDVSQVLPGDALSDQTVQRDDAPLPETSRPTSVARTSQTGWSNSADDVVAALMRSARWLRNYGPRRASGSCGGE